MSGRRVTGEEMRSRLLDSMSRVSDPCVAVLMSGGVDSSSVLYAAIEAGLEPHCYTFAFAGAPSRDYYIARAVCRAEGVRFTPVMLPDSLETLREDIFALHDEYGCVSKTEYECTWPFLYAYQAIEERWVASGLGAEAHFVLTKRGAIHYRNRPDEFREEYWARQNPNQMDQHRILAGKHGKELVFPYMEEETARLFAGSGWDEINRPHHKQPILDAFPERYGSRRVWPQNLQAGSGVSAHFARLLGTGMNTRGYRSVVGILNDVGRGVRAEL